MNKVLNNYNKSKRINGTSKGKIGIVLHLMDKNKSGLITKDNIAIDNIPSHIVTIFDSVIKELCEEDQSLNENEFVSVCYQLYELLTYPEKKQFLNLRKNI